MKKRLRLPDRVPARWPFSKMARAATVVAKRSEFEMSLNRFVFCLVVSTYMIAMNTPALRLELIYMAGYLLFSLGLFAHIRRIPRPIGGRAAVALLADFSAISFEMYAGGATTSVLYPIYLWVILGNGFRFGLHFLFIAMMAALIGFGLVCRTTPFWLHEHFLWVGLMIGLIIVPGYGATLIAKLSAARREAEAANQAKSMFLASVSHSVRTPLNAILGSVGLLEETSLGSEQRELIEQLKIGAGILMSLVSSILDFSQIEANRMPVRLAAVDIGALALKLRLLLAPQARTAGLRLFVHVGPDMPAAVLSDPRHLNEILVNLVSNALKFTEAGGVTLIITALPLANNSVRLRIDVSDTGIGIPEDALGRIFESFTQADGSIIDRFGGTGLGLATVQRLVLLLGGRIDVTSVVGQGSTFSVRLDCPVVPRAESDAPATAPLARTMLFSATGTASILATQLRELSATFMCTTSMTELAAGVEQVRPDAPNALLVLDCPSPEARASMLPMLARADRHGDLPRLLVADNIGPHEGALLSNHFTSWIGHGCSRDELQAAMLRCALPVLPAVVAGSTRMPGSSCLDILVADDNLTNQKLVEKILERDGHRVHLVQNGEDAVIALTERRFDLALLDLNMPVMGGLDAAKEYRFLSLGQESVPLVALTADATQETARRCLEAGMVACITKPITPSALIERVHALAAIPDRADPRPSVVFDLQSHPRFHTARSPIDPEVLTDLERLGGWEFVTDLLDGFVAEARGLGAQITQAALANDLLSFRNQAHALRSVAANVGASIVHDLSGQCRDVAPGDLARTGTALGERIGAAIDRVEQEIAMHGRSRRS